MARTEQRPTWRAVAVPSEHGGWGLTAEPVVLGLGIAFSGAGVAIGVAALLAFIARTPIKVVLVDRWRGRFLDRTRLAARIAAAELAVIAALVTLAAFTAVGRWWPALLIAAPLVVLELWFDMRSRGRRSIPELAGSIGIGAVAAAIALAGGTTALVAGGAWCVIGARSLAAVPFVRFQISRVKSAASPRWWSDAAQAIAVAAVAIGWTVDAVPVAAVVAIVALAVVHVVLARRPSPRAVIVGVQQTVLGVLVVVATILGVRAA